MSELHQAFLDAVGWALGIYVGLRVVLYILMSGKKTI